MAQVNWTDSAIEDLNDIGEYIAKDSQRYAQITVQNLFNSTDVLEQQARIGKMVLAIENKNIRELIRGNYRIVYFIVNDNLIDILTVHHSSRLLENTFDFTDLEQQYIICICNRCDLGKYGCGVKENIIINNYVMLYYILRIFTLWKQNSHSAWKTK